MAGAPPRLASLQRCVAHGLSPALHPDVCRKRRLSRLRGQRGRRARRRSCRPGRTGARAAAGGAAGRWCVARAPVLWRASPCGPVVWDACLPQQASWSAAFTASHAWQAPCQVCVVTILGSAPADGCSPACMRVFARRPAKRRWRRMQRQRSRRRRKTLLPRQAWRGPPAASAPPVSLGMQWRAAPACSGPLLRCSAVLRASGLCSCQAPRHLALLLCLR
jgi:hypothetical protein